eukprot:CAMPEP_0194297994 /NCGR_PEP_ID=MMETSP0169-20130528/59914_1 /TAXON_ID=218684 /ORGANISM="Corethron pennatum, Strain L29A3" /LENGTH=579 /DNA_ID=CAMNT_0039047925 /DNA_START=150 /DNA_END=1892 /DNA_ORIENTATION=+
MCSVLAYDGDNEDKVFNPLVGSCYDLTTPVSWWNNNIDQISGGGGAVCVDVWEDGYQSGRHQRACASTWVPTDFDVSHICCTEDYEEGATADTLYLTRNEDAAPTCGAEAEAGARQMFPELNLCYDLTPSWWNNKIQRIRGGSDTTCIDVWEGGYGEGRWARQCGTFWFDVNFDVSHICCTEQANAAVDPAVVTRKCGAKVADQLFSPEIGKCFDLTGNWWDNQIQTITGGGAGVCVDAWDTGFDEGAHQRVCGADWTNTFFPISHLCCTDEDNPAFNTFTTRSEETQIQSEESTAATSLLQCGAKVGDHLFNPEMGLCYDFTDNWWDNKIELITGGRVGVCVDVWEFGFQDGDHQRVCGADWVDTRFDISHLCCTEQSEQAATQVPTQAGVPATHTCGAKVDDQLFSPEIGKCFDLTGNWWDNQIQTITGGGAGVCVDAWDTGFDEGAHQRVCGADWTNTFFPISHLCCTEEGNAAFNTFTTRSEETQTQSEESTAATSLLQCGAKMGDHLFSPQMGLCYDLVGNGWDNSIETISGGTAGVCVDVWEFGYQTGDHQRVCGASWADASFPISHLCCREE